uniref:Neuromedin U n=1 Tax=Mastacembelus armatus TaxID=205130 RepID=A0A3Q3MNH2_9TELE
MKTLQSQSQPAERGASSSSDVNSLTAARLTLAALLILTIPVCKSKLWELFYLNLFCCLPIDAVCSLYLSGDLKFWASDVLGELCVLMLVQKSKVPHTLYSYCNIIEDFAQGLQGPGGIQSRGYFLYRPRNGRRSLEYE